MGAQGILVQEAISTNRCAFLAGEQPLRGFKKMSTQEQSVVSAATQKAPLGETSELEISFDDGELPLGRETIKRQSEALCQVMENGGLVIEGTPAPPQELFD